MNDLPGENVLDEDLREMEESVPGEEPTNQESKADRVWGFLTSGIPLFAVGLVVAIAGAATWNILVLGAGSVAAFLGLLVWGAGWLPPGAVLWRRLLVKGLNNYREATSADAIGFIVRKSGKVDPRAVKYLGSNTEDQEAKWATASTGEKWGAGVEGSEVDLLGKVPVVFFHEEDPDRVTAKYGRMAEAIDMGQERPLYTGAQIDEVVVERQVFPPGTDAAEVEAATDGGSIHPEQTEVIERDYRVTGGGQLQDAIVDLSSPDGTSGGRISFEKAKELREETATTEEMQRQEDRGRIAELKRGADRKFVLKVMLIAAAIIGIIYLGPMLIEGIFGGGGGDGSSVVPFSIAALTALGVV